MATSNDPYNRKRVIGRRLKFKGSSGDNPFKHKSQNKKRKHQTEELLNARETTDIGVAEQPAPTEVLQGSGRIVSSGKILQGFETKFQEELEIGDVIIVHHPRTLQHEEVIVVGILSQRSLTLNEPFSSDLVSTTSYTTRKDSKRLFAEAAANTRKKRTNTDGSRTEDSSFIAEDENDQSFKELLKDEISRKLAKKIKKAKSSVAIRQKTGMWGYKTVTEHFDRELTAEEQLDMRGKQGRDKHCW